jgi:hypothetical protein
LPGYYALNSVALSRALRLLPLDGRLEKPRSEVAGAFACEIATTEGRSALYVFADMHQCRLEWDDAAARIAFIKRRVIRF